MGTNFAILTDLGGRPSIVNLDDQVFVELNDDRTAVFNDNGGIRVQESITEVIAAAKTWVELTRAGDGGKLWLNPAKVRGALANPTNTVVLVITYGGYELEIQGSLRDVFNSLTGAARQVAVVSDPIPGIKVD